MAISDHAREAISLRNFLGETGIKLQDPTIVNNNNQSAEKLATNPIHHSRTKHIDVRYHFIREAQEEGLVTVCYMLTAEMPADILTKGLFGPKHDQFTKDMGLVRI